MAEQDGHGLIERTLAEPTIAAAFLRMAQERGDAVALHEYGSQASLTYGQWRERARSVAGGLASIGVRRGDRVALLLNNGLRFHVVDLGALLLGAVSFSLYNTAPLDQLLFYVDNAEPTVLVAEEEFAERARELVACRPHIQLVVLAEAREGERTLAELEALCPSDFDLEAVASQVQPEDLATLVYTSGTTGPPKGVQYVHSGIMFALRSFEARLPVHPPGRNISYLPMAHIAERLLGHYAAFVFGYEINALADMSKLQEALLSVRPTRFFGVPRIYEKVETTMQRLLEDPQRGPQMQRALDAGVERVRAWQAAGPGARLEAPPASDAEMLRELREATGLDCGEWLGVSGAPCSRELAERFHAVGLPLNELWGMSESIIGSTSDPDDIRLGTAGYPFDGYDIRLGEDGEILVRSASVTPGYFRDPERTREVIEDGWLHTGDLGSFSDDGYLSVIGRKKDIIINSAGKNMSPANIEQAIRGTDSMIAYVVCVGDARPYNVALIALDPLELRSFAAEHGIEQAPFAMLSQHPRVLEHVREVVQAGNARLSRVEQIKRYEVLDEAWSAGGAELTLTSKMKRASVVEKYADRIDALYAAPRNDDQVTVGR